MGQAPRLAMASRVRILAPARCTIVVLPVKVIDLKVAWDVLQMHSGTPRLVCRLSGPPGLRARGWVPSGQAPDARPPRVL